MSNDTTIVQCPEPVETGNLHFKASAEIKIFNPDGKTFDNSVNLLAVSQHYGLTFIGTLSGFIVLKTKDIFSATVLNDYRRNEITLPSGPTFLTVDHSQKHLAVGCQTKNGPIVFIYHISTLTSKVVSPMKSIPLAKVSQGPVIHLCELVWQPNSDSALTVCFSDGSVTSLSLFLGSGNEVYSLPNTTQARCLCWSPKGKQIVIGCNDGSLCQYKPDLKLVKKLNPPSLFDGNVTVVNILWISSFQFAAAYKDAARPEDFPVIVIVNTPKNEPMNFINYSDITYSCTYFRSHQLYLCHQSAWNLIYIASANSIEVAVLHNKENSLWEQWLLGDASRAEMPLNNERSETFPVGFAIDVTSDQAIPWGEESLPPMPRLLLLSNEGLLTTFNIVNVSPNVPQLCSPPKEYLDDSCFTVKEIPSSSGSTNVTEPQATVPQPQTVATENIKPMFGFGSTASFSPLTSTPLSTPLATPLSTPIKAQPLKQQPVTPIQPQAVDSQSQPQPQNILQDSRQIFQQFFYSSKTSPKQPSKPMFPSGFSENKTAFGENQNYANKSNEGANWFGVKPTATAATVSTVATDLKAPPKQDLEIKDNSERIKTSAPSFSFPSQKPSKPNSSDQLPATTKTVSSKSPETSPSRSAVVDDSVYVNAVLEEIDHFNAELKEVISKVSVLDFQIGTEVEKMKLRKSINELTELREEFNDVTLSLKNDIHSIKIDVIEAFAWLEDAKSRNRQRKSQIFVQLKKLEELDSISNRLMSEIGNMKYYIETQLKQLYAHLDKEWMEHQDNIRMDVRNMMTVPSMEELYKTMHLQLKILNKQQSLVEELSRRMNEKNSKIRSHTSLIRNSSENYLNSVDSMRASELSKLADSLLQTKIDQDHNSITFTDAFQLMAKEQMKSIAERSRKFSSHKQNVLKDAFGEREMIKTRSVKPTLGASSFIRNNLTKIYEKRLEKEKSQKPSPTKLEESAEGLAVANVSVSNGLASGEVTGIPTPSSTPSTPAKSFGTVTTTASGWNSGASESQKPFISFNTPSAPAAKDKQKSPQLFTFSVSKSTESSQSNKTEESKNINAQKSSPFVFKATSPFGGSVMNPTGSPMTQVLPTAISSSSTPTISFTSNIFEKSTPATTSIFNSKSFLDQATSTNSFIKTPSTMTNFSAGGNLSTLFSNVSFGATTSTATAASTTATVTTSTTTSTTATITTTTTTTTITTSTSKITPATTSSFTFGSTLSSPSTFSFGSFNLEKTTSSSVFDVKTPYNFSFSAVAPTKPTDSGSENSKPTPKLSLEIKPSGASPVTTVKSSIFTFGTSQSKAPTAAPVAPTSALVAPVLVAKTDVLQKSTESVEDSGETTEKKNEDNENGAAVVPELSSDALEASKPEVESSGESNLPADSSDVAPAATVTSTPMTTTNVVYTTPTVTTAVSVTPPPTDESVITQTVPTSATSVFSTVTSTVESEKPASPEVPKTDPVTTSSNIFAQTAAVATSSSNIFGQASQQTTSSPAFGQNKVDQTTDLFGQMLGSNLSGGSVFGGSSSPSSNNIFGKSAFDSKSGGNIFGGVAATTAATTTTTSIFGTTSSILSGPATTFGQTSNSSSVFGLPQVSGSSNNFFGQSICTSFGSSTTAAPNQNPFVSTSGFNSKPVFGQSLFGTSTTQPISFRKSPSISIFGNASTTTSMGGNIFQSGTSSFGSAPPGPFSGGQTTAAQSGFGSSSTFQKPLGGFGSAPVFGSLPVFGAASTFGAAPTFGTQSSFGNPQVFSSPQGTFGQSQTQATNFETLASQSADGFASLAQKSQSSAFGGAGSTAFGGDSTFEDNSAFGGDSFCSWRS